MEKSFKSETKEFIKSLNEKAKAVSYVSIGAIEEHLIDGHISFAIDRKDNLVAKVNYWEYYDKDHWTFFGDLTGKHLGDVHINIDSTGDQSQDGKTYLHGDISKLKNGKFHITVSDGKTIVTSQFIKL